jgi:DNA-binding transcriptional LysR family regulator
LRDPKGARVAVRSRGRQDVEGLDDGRLLYVSDTRTAEVEVDFRQLEYFQAVAEELHFGRAAQRMFITQPALSQAIAGLERTLDVELFARTRQNVELTDAGTELLRHARGMLSDREAAVAAVRRVSRGEAGVLRVGIALLYEHEVAPAFAEFGTECPELLLDRTSAVSERLLASLVNRDLHAAIVHQVPVLGTAEEVEWEVLRSGRLAALVSEGSDLAGREVVSLSELSEERFLVPPRELAPSAVEGMKTMCRTYGDFEPEVLELSTLGTDWGPVRRGEAVALMGEGTALATRVDGAVAVPLEVPPPFLLALAWRRGNGAPTLHRFLDFLRAYRDEHAWAEDHVPAQSA